MLTPELLFPFILIGILCLLHLVITLRKSKSDMKLKRDEHFIIGKQIAAQEETFQKISAEIHDNISLTLSLARLYLNDAGNSGTCDAGNKISMSSSLIRKAIEDLNNLSKSLSSEAIEKFGLVRAVEEQINDVKKAGLFTIHFDVEGVQRPLGSHRELILFRIIQESLNNIIRHAGASLATIAFTFSNESLKVEITDDGTGFQANSSTRVCNGSGLNNMRKRAQLLQAHIFIESLPRAGTTIKIVVPVHEKIKMNAYREHGN